MRNSKTPTGARWRWRVIRKGLLLLAIMGSLAWLLSRCQESVGRNIRPVGYSQGLWHGAIMPCAMPLLLLGRDISIYAPLNTGLPYKLGYTMGVNACGLVFFGFLFARLGRWRQRLQDRNFGGSGSASSAAMTLGRAQESGREERGELEK